MPIFREHNRAPQACRLAASPLMQVMGDVTGQTASDWASSTLRGPGSNSEVYLSGQAGGSLAALNAAAIYAPTSKEN